MIKKTFLFFFIFSFKLYSYINIHPTTFDKPIDNGGNWEEYILYNRTPNPIRYLISIVDKNESNSMKDWIEIYPRALTVKPGKNAKIKIFIKAPLKTPEGEYFATLDIKETLLSSFEENNNKKAINILTHLKMDIVGHVGELPLKIKLNNFEKKITENKLLIKGEVENLSKRRGNILIVLSNNKKREDYLLGKIRILKNEKINLSKFSHEIKDKDLLKKLKKYKKILIIDEKTQKKIFESTI
ncbi:MAG: hypothetical protein ACRDAG_12495 [Cetobacterium somerae]|uniref:hypothetical protein n=1 Tax=Cetobacterium somerae TaxID=188913 RepID=UPI003F2DDC72